MIVAPTAIKKKRYQNVVFSSFFISFFNKIQSHSFWRICEDAHEYYSLHFESQSFFISGHGLTARGLFVCLRAAVLCNDPLKTIDGEIWTSASSSQFFVFIEGQTWQTVAFAKQLHGGHDALCQTPCSRVGCQHWANARLVKRQSQHPFQMSIDAVQSLGIPDISNNTCQRSKPSGHDNPIWICILDLIESDLEGNQWNSTGSI